MVDIHSHIIPGIDDGPKDLKTSLDMIRRAYDEGVKDIIATPHYRRGVFEEPLSGVKDIVKNLNLLAKKEGMDINIHYGQEIYFTENIIEDLEEGLIGTINGGRYMLLEFSMRKIPEEALDYIYELTLRGITPIIAHPERYSDIIRNPEKINELIHEGCLFQLNCGSVRGDFGRDVKKCAETLIKSGIYSFIGSDGHNNDRRRTGIKEECEEVFKKNGALEEVFKESSKKILNNEEIFFGGEKIKKKRGFFFR